MSSMAFFIEAAAKTVRLFPCADAGEGADPQRIARATKAPANRYMGALRAKARRAFARGVRQWSNTGCDRRKRVPPSRRLTVGRDNRGQNNNRLTVRVKSPNIGGRGRFFKDRTSQRYCLASGAAKTWRQAAGNCAIVIAGLGFGGSGDGLG